MIFPHADRVLYQLNPLLDVTCKLNFPPILRIDAVEPVDFQERVRRDFPFFQVKPAVNLTTNLPANIRVQIGGNLLLGGKSYVFDSSDRKWTLTVTKDTLALSCRQYQRWEQMRERFRELLATLSHIYSPGFFT